jgi:peptidoglycan/xylan/chitin deacetylase (PgdA/CDA1 family)
MTIPSSRAPYSAIVDRPRLPPLPGGTRMIVWTIINVEVWDISRPMPRTVLVPPQDKPLMPDVPNWSWHEYGMRVGFWRFMSLFGRLGIRGTLAINGRVCVDYPRVARAAKDAGWEFMGHGYDQLPTHLEKDQVGMMKRTVETITTFTGKAPIGWLAPGLSETLDTPDNLSAAGIKYIADWVYDDEPTTLTTANGPLVTIPYSLETNDIPVCVVQHHESSYWAQKCRDQFDQLYAESATRPKFMGIAIHPYVSGQPFRFKYLESIYAHIGQYADVAHWTGEQIYEWYVAAHAAVR